MQCMGLSGPVLQGVLKKGYKVPTPIQRKVSDKPLWSTLSVMYAVCSEE